MNDPCQGRSWSFWRSSNRYHESRWVGCWCKLCNCSRWTTTARRMVGTYLVEWTWPSNFNFGFGVVSQWQQRRWMGVGVLLGKQNMYLLILAVFIRRTMDTDDWKRRCRGIREYEPESHAFLLRVISLISNVDRYFPLNLWSRNLMLCAIIGGL